METILQPLLPILRVRQVIPLLAGVAVLLIGSTRGLTQSCPAAQSQGVPQGWWRPVPPGTCQDYRDSLIEGLSIAEHREGGSPSMPGPREKKITPVQFVPPLPEPQKEADEFGMRMPTPDQLFQVQSEAEFRERLRAELPKVKKIDFPKDASLIPEISARNQSLCAEYTISWVPVTICHRPVYYYGRDLENGIPSIPCMAPFVALGRFYVDTALLPYRMIRTPPWSEECDHP